MATSILRMVAACWASFESNWSRSSLVTPSTTAATAGPNSSSIWARVSPVSSTASCSERRGHVCGVEAELGHDRGHGHRVGDVRLAGAPELALVGLGGKAVGAPHEFEVVTGAPGTERRQDALDLEPSAAG